MPRRFLSLVLLVAFALPIAAPLLALAQEPDAGLPACCRRHGVHHCTMPIAEQRGDNGSAPRIVATCPQFPQHSVAPLTNVTFLSSTEARGAVHVQVSLDVRQRNEPPHRTTPTNTHPKRGPPAGLI